MHTIKRIREIISLATQSLEDATEHYWPVVNPESNGLQEANLTIHFAIKAAQQNLYVYPEASNGELNGGHQRLDLLVKGRIADKDVVIMVESKKLFSAEKAAEMSSDFNKMEKFKLVNSPLRQNIQDATSRYAVLLAISTSTSTQEWWCEPYQWDGKSWDSLKKILLTADERGAIQFSIKYPQYILYAIFQLQ